jgi:hypothetical protein
MPSDVSHSIEPDESIMMNTSTLAGWAVTVNDWQSLEPPALPSGILSAERAPQAAMLPAVTTMARQQAARLRSGTLSNGNGPNEASEDMTDDQHGQQATEQP